MGCDDTLGEPVVRQRAGNNWYHILLTGDAETTRILFSYPVEQTEKRQGWNLLRKLREYFGS